MSTMSDNKKAIKKLIKDGNLERMKLKLDFVTSESSLPFLESDYQEMCAHAIKHKQPEMAWLLMKEIQDPQRQRQLANGSPELLQRLEFENRFQKLETFINSNDYEVLSTEGQQRFSDFLKQDGAYLKTLIEQKNGQEYQNRLATMLVHTSTEHTRGLSKTKKGSDLHEAMSAQMTELRQSMIDAGANLAHDGYRAVNVVEGNNWTVCYGMVFEALAQDNSKQKLDAVRGLLERIIADGYSVDFVHDMMKKSGLSVEQLGTDMIENCKDKHMAHFLEFCAEKGSLSDAQRDALALRFDKEIKSLDRIAPIRGSFGTSSRGKRVDTAAPPELITSEQKEALRAMVDAGVDMSRDGYRAVEVMAKRGYVDLLSHMLESIKDPDARRRAATLAANAGVRSEHAGSVSAALSLGADPERIKLDSLKDRNGSSSAQAIEVLVEDARSKGATQGTSLKKVI